MPLNSNDLAGICAMLMVFGIPIIAILPPHQRKMAIILHNRQDSMASEEARALRAEIQELKALVHEQSITLDNLGRPIPTETRLQERVG